jgi:1-acyl-sn-glycerol-3-phosphate acyltransferase
MLGRVDADMLTVTDEHMRGRVFSIKGFFFTSALMVPLLYIAFNDTYDARMMLSYFIPWSLTLFFFPVIAISWFLDCAMYSKRPVEAPGPMDRFIYTVVWYFCRIFSKFYFRYSVVGLEKIPKTGKVLLAANHGSFMDPFLLGTAMPRRVRYIMHASYYRGMMHPIFRVLGNIPVEDGKTLQALKLGTQILDNGDVLGIFPEGHVTETGKLQEPKEGALFMAQRSGAPVYPVALKGNVASWPRKGKFPMPTRITCIVGDPIQVPKDASREQVAELTDKLMEELARMLEEPPPPKTAGKPKRQRDRGENKSDSAQPPQSS